MTRVTVALYATIRAEVTELRVREETLSAISTSSVAFSPSNSRQTEWAALGACLTAFAISSLTTSYAFATAAGRGTHRAKVGRQTVGSVMMITVTKPANQDHLLAPDQYPALNEEFYRARPNSYFEKRLAALLHVLRDPSLTAGPAEPVVVGAIRMTPAESDDGPDDERLMDYAAVEATQLLHHATETMFRLYMAHKGIPRCPWLEACKIPAGRQFWQRLQAVLDGLDAPEGRADVTMCFRGFRDFESATLGGYELDEQAWQHSTEGLVELLRIVGRRLGTDNIMYNAMKHGLAAISNERGVELRRAVDDAPLIEKHGPSVRTLEYDRQTGRWSRWTRWIEVDAAIALASLVIAEIEAVMGVGRVRYLRSPDPVRFVLLRPDEVRLISNPSAGEDQAGPLNVESVRMELSYYVRQPDEPDDSRAAEG